MQASSNSSGEMHSIGSTYGGGVGIGDVLGKRLGSICIFAHTVGYSTEYRLANSLRYLGKVRYLKVGTFRSGR